MARPQVEIGDERPGLPFEFFQLSRELRDMIHGFTLLMEEFGYGRSGELLVSARQTVDPRLLLICRQFRDEYRETAQKKTAIIIKDGNLEACHCPMLPLFLDFVTRFDLNISILHLAPANASRSKFKADDIMMHRGWMRQLFQQRHPPVSSYSLTVQIHETPYMAVSEAMLKAHLMSLVFPREMESMDVLYYGGVFRNRSKIGPSCGIKKLVLRYCAETESL